MQSPILASQTVEKASIYGFKDLVFAIAMSKTSGFIDLWVNLEIFIYNQKILAWFHCLIG